MDVIEKNATGRITYIDAMRGLAMTLVVIYHVTGMSFYSGNRIVGLINQQFQIPLFFLISGYFMKCGSSISIWRNIWAKFKILVIPAFLMLTLYVVAFQKGIQTAIDSSYHSGYWFTFVLFIFITIFEISNRLIEKLTHSSRVIQSMQVCLGLLFVVFSVFISKYQSEYRIISILSMPLYFNYLFFVTGVIWKINQESIFRLLSNAKIIGIILAVLIVGNIVVTVYNDILGATQVFIYVLLQILGLSIILKLFRSYPQISEGSMAGNFLTLVGRRTLDVYFIHYFLLPGNMFYIGKFFNQNSAPFVEYLLAIVIAVPLIYASLGIGVIIRQSSYTAKYLLGVNPKKHHLGV